jgi:hypothetical protein
MEGHEQPSILVLVRDGFGVEGAISQCFHFRIDAKDEIYCIVWDEKFGPSSSPSLCLTLTKVSLFGSTKGPEVKSLEEEDQKN